MSCAARLTYLGHSTALIELDGLRILTDPVLGGIGPLRRLVPGPSAETYADVDLVLISHGHHDHLELPSLRMIPGRPAVIVPRGFGRLVERAMSGRIAEVMPGDVERLGSLRIEIVYAAHSTRREPFGPTGGAVGFVVGGERTIYFPGDTDLFPEMRNLAGRLDAALIPVWGWGPNLGRLHMDPVRAATAAGLLRPRLAVPIHWGTLYPAGLRRLLPRPFESPGARFADAARERAPGVRVKVLAPGESVEVS